MILFISLPFPDQSWACFWRWSAPSSSYQRVWRRCRVARGSWSVWRSCSVTSLPGTAGSCQPPTGGSLDISPPADMNCQQKHFTQMYNFEKCNTRSNLCGSIKVQLSIIPCCSLGHRLGSFGLFCDKSCHKSKQAIDYLWWVMASCCSSLKL